MLWSSIFILNIGHTEFRLVYGILLAELTVFLETDLPTTLCVLYLSDVLVAFICLKLSKKSTD